MNGDFDLVGVTGERFVDGVVHDFVDQMMQSDLARRADIHGGTFADGFHSAQHFDGIGSVVPVAPVDGGEPPVFFLRFDDGGGVSVSFVAIQLRGECRNLGLGARFFRSPELSLKLLKLLTLTASKVMS